MLNCTLLGALLIHWLTYVRVDAVKRSTLSYSHKSRDCDVRGCRRDSHAQLTLKILSSAPKPQLFVHYNSSPVHLDHPSASLLALLILSLGLSWPLHHVSTAVATRHLGGDSSCRRRESLFYPNQRGGGHRPLHDRQRQPPCQE